MSNDEITCRKEMKAITGQYECLHASGVGLDYFTSRIDRLTLNTNGRFLLNVQKQSRASNAAKKFISGQQTTTETTETRLEGSYTQQDLVVALQFDNGGFEQAQLTTTGEGLQIGPNLFNKVSDSTMLPPTHRMKQDMDDIAKGLKIASTLGGFAVKAAKTIQGTVQSVQGTTSNQPTQAGPAPQTTPPTPPPAYIPTGTAAAQNNQPMSPPSTEARFCDHCGERIRPGKRFCNNCGARV